MNEVKFEIVKNLITLPANGKWAKEVNRISWDGRDPVYDIRGWNEDHTKMTKGITLTEVEFNALVNLIQEGKFDGKNNS